MDKNTFIKILESHRDRVFSYVLYCLRDRDDAEDVTQDVFVRLWRNRDAVDAGRVGAWLIRVAHNLCVDHARRRRTARTHLGRDGALAVESRAAAASFDDPVDNLQREQIRTALLDAMTELQEETRSAMIMHYFQGMKIQEVAAALDAKTSTIKVRIHRARKVLRGLLESGGEIKPAGRRETV